MFKFVHTLLVACIALNWPITSDCSRGINYDAPDPCREENYHYELTECDVEEGRWRVSVPTLGVCPDLNPTPAVRINSCRIACDAGFYFHLGDLTCRMCRPGTYSLGGGALFDSWFDLPEGFFTQVESFKSAFANKGRSSGDMNCSRYGWQPRGDFLASMGGPCAATLTYAVHLVKPGNLTYFYQYSDKEVIFDFKAQNDQCQSVTDSTEFRWPPSTREGEWKQQTVRLKAGQNVLQWKTIGMDTHKGKPVLLKAIEISGVAFASSCVACRAGTYSRAGARVCEECPANTFSPRESSSCISCNNATEFSEKASSACKRRELCTRFDYYEVRTPCDADNQTRRMWKWMDPKICRDDVPEAVTLPPPSEKRKCPPCNPGMDYMKGVTCEFCPKFTYSDGKSGCVPCPPNSSPNYGIEFVRWATIPRIMKTACLESDGVKCVGNMGWQPAGTFIHSGHNRHTDGSYLLLSITVSGFRSKGGIGGGRRLEVGLVSFSFELECNNKCDFVFMQGTESKGVTVVETWSEAQRRQDFVHTVYHNDSYTFSWAFQKLSLNDANGEMKLEDDVAKIFSINVTNTIEGGASFCFPCHQDSIMDDHGCIPCPPGEYVDSNTTECTPCPPNTTVSDPLAYGVQSCQPCGPGLVSYDGVSCVTNCAFMVEGKTYDLRSLAQPYVVRGSVLFTASGASYYHLFNISLCGQTSAQCSNNASFQPGLQSQISSFVCRTTIVPSQLVEGDVLLATQSVTLGDELVGVTNSTTFLNMQVIDEFASLGPSDLHFYYSTPSATHSCPQGRTTIITLHCDPNEKGNGTIELPSKCPDGTCNGCSFSFLWASNKACPVCTREDYRVVKGECLGGTRIVHLLAPASCLMPSTLGTTRSETCSTRIPIELQIAISVVVALALFLCGLMLYFWKKTQSLEYKYMKLVQSASGRDGEGEVELPSTESCALDDGEDEGEEVQFTKPRPVGILNRIMGIANKSDSATNQFETIQLTKN